MKTILVVEDDPLIFDFYHELLTGHGYNVLPAFNGHEALQHLQNHILDLIVLDMSLPQMHGRSLLSHIKKFARHVPVIISTGKVGMQDDPEITMSTQVKKFLIKPVPSTLLINTIHQVLYENMHRNLEGRAFAGCQLNAFIEAGSSGTVYRATKDDKLIAVKVLAFDPEKKHTQRPPYEAEILCKLRHRNIIEILAMGIEEDLPFIVMEYFEGESIHKIIQRQGMITLAESIQILIQICDGMSASHAQHLIHRDIKPSNILYQRKENLAKIIDFGIAHQLDDKVGYEVIGSPYYMSPEQCRGEVVGPESDIYSLGVTFFQMITGSVPFACTDTHSTLVAHIQAPVEWPSKINQLIPMFVKDVVVKMLAKNKKDRHQSMIEVKQDLEKIKGML